MNHPNSMSVLHYAWHGQVILTSSTYVPETVKIYSLNIYCLLIKKRDMCMMYSIV